LQAAKERSLPPWQIVQESARRRIFKEVHPAVKVSREYPFIGDISSGFAEWIKQRWLRNIVDQEPDDFPRYAVGKFVKKLQETP